MTLEQYRQVYKIPAVPGVSHIYINGSSERVNRVSDDVDSVSGAIDNNSDKIDTDYIQMPYDNDDDNATGKKKSE